MTLKKQKATAPLGSMRIERIPVKRISAAAYNPRKNLKPGDPEWEKIKRSIGEFGYVDTLVWNMRTGNLVGGHQRLKVLVAEFKVKAVDVSVVDLPLAKEKALNIALNRISGEWDTTALADLLSELQAADDVDAAATGFDQKEIDVAIAEALAAGPSEDDAAFAMEQPLESGVPAVLVVCESVRAQKATAAKLKRQGYQCKMTTV